MTKDIRNAGALFAAGIQTGGLGARSFGYFLFYVPAVLVFFLILFASKGFGGIIDLTFLPKNLIGYTIFAFFFPPAIPFFFWEKSISMILKNGSCFN